MKRMPPIAASLGVLLALCVCPCPLCAEGAQAPAARQGATQANAESLAVARAVASAPDSNSLEVRAFRLLNRSIENRVFDAMMPVASDFGKFRIAVILIWCALVLFGKVRGRWAALMLVLIIFASDQLSSHLIKPIFERVRPCDAIGGVHLYIGGKEGWITTPPVVARAYKPSFSFPSSHAANITASMLFLGLVYRRWFVPLLAVAAIVSLSRIYVGVHWVSDVATGIVIGAIIAGLAYWALVRLYRTFTRSEPDTPPSG
jgi:undecaprenyl-diphosphatase